MAKNPTTEIQKECDDLFQEIGKLKCPKSFISNNPTNVIHHFVPKATSSALRYDWDNGIPLTNGEHMRHHRAGDPEIHTKIIMAKGGIKWADDIRQRGRAYHKVNMEMYRKVKERLEAEKADFLSQL